MEEKKKNLREARQLLGSGTGKPLGNRELWNKVALVLCLLILNRRHPLFRDPMGYTCENTVYLFSCCLEVF